MKNAERTGGLFYVFWYISRLFLFIFTKSCPY